MQARFGLTLFILMATACIDSSRVNTTCTLIDPLTERLDLKRAADREHLRVDAQLAGELGQRFADVRFRNRPNLGDPIQERCTNALMDTIARRRGIGLSAVKAAATDRVWWADLLSVYLPLAVVAALVMDGVTRRICRSFDPEDRMVAIAAAVIFVPVTALLGLGLGQIWAFSVEGWYLRNEHVAFRAFLVPIIRHGWIGYFALLGICSAVALNRFRVTPLRTVSHSYATLRLAKLRPDNDAQTLEV